MDIPSVLGVIGMLIDLVRATPQLVHLLRMRKSFGVSVDTSGTSSIVSFGWATYGYITGQPYVMLASGLMATIFFINTVIALRLGRSVREFRIAPFWLVVLLLSGLLFGKGGLGMILSISALVSSIPQIRVAYRESDLSGLSLGTWLLSLSGGIVWGTYGLLKHDLSIIASAFFQITTSVTIISLKMMSRQPKDNLPVSDLLPD